MTTTLDEIAAEHIRSELQELKNLRAVVLAMTRQIEMQGAQIGALQSQLAGEPARVRQELADLGVKVRDVPDAAMPEQRDNGIFAGGVVEDLDDLLSQAEGPALNQRMSQADVGTLSRGPTAWVPEPLPPLVVEPPTDPGYSDKEFLKVVIDDLQGTPTEDALARPSF